MTTQIRAFRPLAPTQVTAVTGTSQTITLNWNLGTRALLVHNSGTDTIFVSMRSDGSIAPALLVGSVPMLPNTSRVFTIAQETTQIAVIGAAGTGSTLYTTIGEGL